MVASRFQTRGLNTLQSLLSLRPVWKPGGGLQRENLMETLAPRVPRSSEWAVTVEPTTTDGNRNDTPEGFEGGGPLTSLLVRHRTLLVRSLQARCTYLPATTHQQKWNQAFRRFFPKAWRSDFRVWVFTTSFDSNQPFRAMLAPRRNQATCSRR